MKALSIFKKDPVLGYGALGLLVIIVAYYFGSRTGKGSALADARNQLDAEIAQTPLTYEISQYSVFADRIHAALQPLIFINKDAVNAVFAKMRTRTDVLQLISSFGKRTSWLWAVGDGSLAGWLTLRMSEKEIDHINSILARNDINYLF